MNDIPQITVAELAGRRDDITLVDVRTPEEFAQARVPGATLVPLADLPERIGELPGGTLHLICRSGARSRTACEYLIGLGRDAVNVGGGILAWIEAGHAVDEGDVSS